MGFVGLLLLAIVTSIVVARILGTARQQRGGTVQSVRSWDNMLSDPRLDINMSAGLDTDFFTYVIAKVLKPMRVDYMKFTSNLFYLMGNGDPSMIAQIPNADIYRWPTPSVDRLAGITQRPDVPIWMVAAFPDLYAWINDPRGTDERAQLLLSGIPEDQVTMSSDQRWNSPEAIETFRRMVENYRARVGPTLETQ